MSRDQIPAASAATFKPRDVEELIDFYLHRRVANVAVRLLAPTQITPNQVTVLSGVVAIVAGVLIWTAGDRPWQLLLGAGVFFLSIVLDCTDGQLARLRRESSLAGRMLDGSVDVVSIGSLMVGQLGWLLHSGQSVWVGLVVGWAAGFSVRWHAHTYDHIKNVYLHNTQASDAGLAPALPTMDEIEREQKEHERAGRWFAALLCRGFRGFTRVQRRGMTDQTGLDRPAMTSPAERERYRRRFRRYMRMWSFNGVGTHLFLFVVATVVAPLWPTAPLWAWLFVCGPMNLFTLYLGRSRRRLEAELQGDLAELREAA